MRKLRPILFQTEMVQANLQGRKTQTRRFKKLEKVNSRPNDFDSPVLDSTGEWVFTAERGQPEQIRVKCPYGIVGDVLWVRETVIVRREHDTENHHQMFQPNGFAYKADCGSTMLDHLKQCGCKVNPSIHMPFEACRLFLEITNIRVERLQEISRGDAMQEGCPFPNMANGENPKNWFRALWRAINGKESWQSNPWVWVVEFRHITKEEALS